MIVPNGPYTTGPPDVVRIDAPVEDVRPGTVDEDEDKGQADAAANCGPVVVVRPGAVDDEEEEEEAARIDVPAPVALVPVGGAAVVIMAFSVLTALAAWIVTGRDAAPRSHGMAAVRAVRATALARAACKVAAQT